MNSAVAEELPVLLRVEDLAVSSSGDYPLVRGVDLIVDRNETVALVGESGSGKTLTARALIGLLPHSLDVRGTLHLEGRRIDLKKSSAFTGLRGSAISLLLQDPFTSLSPVHSIEEQIGWTLRDRSSDRLSGVARSTEIGRLLEAVRLPSRVRRAFPHELSGGMRQRAALATTLAAQPRILIADEPTTALDAVIQHGILSLINDLKREFGMGVLLISHDLHLVENHSDRIMVMHGGSIVERGATVDVLAHPAHPYTAGLLASTPSIDQTDERLPAVPWQPTDASAEFDFGPGYRSADAVRRLPALTLVRWRKNWDVGVIREDDTYHLGSEFEQVSLRQKSISAIDLADDEPVLVLDRVSQRFGKQLVLDNVSVQVRRAEAVGLVGESGSGKTSLARIAVGLDCTTSGTVKIRPARNRLEGNPIQIVFQDPYSSLNPTLTVGATLREALRIAGRPAALDSSLLEQVALPTDLLDRSPLALSGGQRQRVSIARALAAEPDILVCDEAVSALDVSVQAQILNLLDDLKTSLGISLLFISHDLGVIRYLCDTVYVLRHGEVVEHGPTGRIFEHPQSSYTKELLLSASNSVRRK